MLPVSLPARLLLLVASLRTGVARAPEACKAPKACEAEEPRGSVADALLQAGRLREEGWPSALEEEKDVHAGSAADDAVRGWKETVSWMLANGASVNAATTGNLTRHGRGLVRGVVTKAALETNATILRIPRRLWIYPGNFPVQAFYPLMEIPACKRVSSNQAIEILRLSAALVAEARNASSFYQPYLRNLPKLSDFRSFHPHMISEKLAKEFEGLSVVADALQVRHGDQSLRECFEAWKQRPDSCVAEADWEDMQEAIMRVRTRAYRFKWQHYALIPGSDLLNTNVAAKLNTDWALENLDIDNPGPFTVLANRPIAAGAELYDSYCPQCSNYGMLSRWGIYMEDNANKVNQFLTGYARCLADDGGADSALHRAAERALDLSEAGMDFYRSEGLRAPRCRAEVFEATDGPLRCSLARLAYETCHEAWSAAAAGATKPDSDASDLRLQTGAPR